MLSISGKVCQAITKVGLSSDLNFFEHCFHVTERKNEWQIYQFKCPQPDGYSKLSVLLIAVSPQ